MIRRAAGAPITVTSGFRCAKHNARVGGAQTSRHMIGCASDISIARPISYSAFVEISARFKVDGGEFVSYPEDAFIHFAVPRIEAEKTWDGGVMYL